MGEFDSFRALSFDCYGTLIDWEAGIAAELVPWAQRNGMQPTVEDVLAHFAAVETVVQAERPDTTYPDVLAEVLRRLGHDHGVAVTDAEAADFGASVARWPAFPDSTEALARLKTRFRLIVLSNIDRGSFAASNARLGVEFDLILTAQDIGSYKPDPHNFESLLRATAERGIGESQLLHVAQSLYHDHVPAKAVGLPTVWIDRRAGKAGGGATPAPPVDVTPDWRFETLAAFADAAVGVGA
jgi:2-haloalkanoic acid dehalogenase type II